MTARRGTYVAAEGVDCKGGCCRDRKKRVITVSTTRDTDVAASMCTGVAARMEAGVDRANVTSACCGGT